MASTYMTPGVYIEEKNAFPNSAVAVETAVPVFIGYTETAELNGNSLLNRPTRIISLAEYLERFGPSDPTKPFKPKCSLTKVLADADITALTDAEAKQKAKNQSLDKDGSVNVNGVSWHVDVENPLYLFNSMRLFYDNGGSVCYIISVGTYGDNPTLAVSSDDFTGTTAKPITPFDLLKKETEPTLVVMPDAIALGASAYNTVYTTALEHCNDIQSRFAILDLAQQTPMDSTDTIVEEFRTDMRINFLNYGAAYYPWLKTAVVSLSEIDLDNLDVVTVAATAGKVSLLDVLPEPNAIAVLKKFNTDTDTANAAIQPLKDALTPLQQALDAAKTAAALPAASDADKLAVAPAAAAAAAAQKKVDDAVATPAKLKDNVLQALKAVSPTFVNILEKVRSKMNELPPSGAIAGIYTIVDNNRGVWKAPANVSINMVNAPSVNISSEGQQNLNVDVTAGKSINVIRSFPGIGTLVWGARTLDGNSADWCYINVRRTLIMIEQSLKLAARAYVFVEPNDANTWITVKSMIENFLVNLWKQGALAGAAPDQAFNVQVGLGSTMTGNDILLGKMLITVKVAIVRPAEFIVITFQQQMQQS